MSDDARMLQINVVDLEIGMYVAELDRPWIDTPFLVEGFYIESQDDIDRLHELCRHVVIDPRRSRAGKRLRSSRIIGHHHELKGRQATGSAGPDNPAFGVARHTELPVLGSRKRYEYLDQASVDQELVVARRAYNTLLRQFAQCWEAVAAGGQIDLSWVRAAIAPLIDSIVRNPDAAVWYARVKDAKNYGPRHAVSCAIWMAAFARELGLPVAELTRTATGALLLDIGKFGIPEALLNKQETLSTDEFRHLQTHVQLGLLMVRHSGLGNHTVTEMIETHHERYGGHGYPKGLSGDEIPLYGQMAGIVDCFDAITSKRVYAPAIGPAEAVKRLNAWRESEFNPSLVEAFIRAIGLYPAGTLVELSDGAVAVVFSGYRQNKLRPCVLPLLDAHKQPVSQSGPLDLAHDAHDVDGQPRSIVATLAPGAYGLDPEAL